MNKQTVIALILIIALVLIGYFVWSTDKVAAPTDMDPDGDGDVHETMPEGDTAAGTQLEGTPEGQGMNPGTGVVVGGDAVASVGVEKSFTITGSNFAFAQKEIRVKKGDIVHITFVNSGGTHDWRLEGYNVKTAILQGGAQETVTFTADKAGSFVYYCSVGSHRAMGMTGTLVVE